MKRLKNKLLSMQKDEITYAEMYNGEIIKSYNGITVKDYDPTYYYGDVGYAVTETHKLAQDRPTVTVMIPADKLINDKGGMPMKRLKHYLLGMDNNTATYKEMYEGRMVVLPETNQEPYIDHSNDYYYEDNMVTIEQTNKLAQDKPTLTWYIPTEKLGFDHMTAAAADFCLRKFAPYIDSLNSELYNRSRPDNENGKYYLHRPGGEILKYNTAYFSLCPQRDYEYSGGDCVRLIECHTPPKICLCLRMQIQLPKRKLRKTIQMLCRDLPDAVDRFLDEFDIVGLDRAIELAQKQTAIREWLKNSDYCAFVANGSILPRSKGTDLPMENAVPFMSAPEDEIEICGIRGMGIKKGVTVITGGGYSGKSTLLDAISAGIYDHVPGDGRELCITDESAVTISAEDGRSVKHINISPFIKWLPGGDTSDFSTDHASGSTSQAANIMEAIDSGAKLLLIDEDRSATNFMIRDRMMKELIEKEPITPFTDRVKELSEKQGVSTILVIGGSGEYLSVADKIYMMEDYKIHDVTKRSKEICSLHGMTYRQAPTSTDWNQNRVLYSEGFTSFPMGSTSEKLEVSDMGYILIGDERIELRGLHDIVSKRQLDALGYMLRYLEISNNENKIDITRKIDELYSRIENEGVDILYSSYFTTTERFLDLPRKQELTAVINRMRKINFAKGGDPQ